MVPDFGAVEILLLLVVVVVFSIFAGLRKFVNGNLRAKINTQCYNFCTTCAVRIRTDMTLVWAYPLDDSAVCKYIEVDISPVFGMYARLILV